MKTYYLFTKKNAIFSLFGLMAIITTSCGSYQNASYYDDGVYTTSEKQKVVVVEDNSQNNNAYSQKFKEMQNDYVYYTEDDTEKKDSIVTVYNTQ